MVHMGLSEHSWMASMHTFESPLKMTWLHLSEVATRTAQAIASASACKGDLFGVILAQILSTEPWDFLATTAKAALEEEIAASMLILIVPGGGEDQFGVEGSGLACSVLEKRR